MGQNKVTTVYLVRHGTTAWNQALRYQGRADNPLDEIGERHSQDHEVPILIEPDVIEIDFGVIDGWTKEEIEAAYPEFYRMYILDEDRGHAQVPGGESMVQVYDRMTSAVMRIAREHPGQNIVISSHGTAIQTFLNFASGISADQVKRFLLYNVCVSCVEIDENGRAAVKYIGDKHHVPEELQFSYGSIPKK